MNKEREIKLDGEVSDTKPLRVYICGSHSSGKSTLARWISKRYKLPLVTEVVRSVIAEREIHLDQMLSDLDLAMSVQKEIAERQVYSEDATGDRFVSDRAFDNLAYAANHTIKPHEIAEWANDYIERVKDKDSLVFFVRPNKQLITADGVRHNLEWEEIVRIDGMIKLLLGLYNINYVSIDSINMVDRARTASAVIECKDPLLRGI